ncbi:MAG TPA: DMT family transporter [Gemmatimonadales bacterium]|nr:DMT family transporter [Gemmatimonadales bacterium]
MVYLLAIASAVFYGAADFAGGLTTRRAGTIPVVFLSQASGLALLALMLLFLPGEPSLPDFAWGAAAGLTGGVGVALLYRALAVGVMAVVAPTTAVCAVIIPVVVSILLGERPLPLVAAGILLGIWSIVLVSRQTSPRSLSSAMSPGRVMALPPGVGMALISGVAIGFFFLSLAQTRSEAGMWPILASRTVSTVLFGSLVLVRRESLRMSRSTLGLVVLAGTVDMLANALYLEAARQGPLSVVVTLSSLYPASTVLLARIALGERLNGWQVTGVGCALAAIVLIVSGDRSA